MLAFIFLYCNLGSVCSHCLYNAATGWSRIFGSHMRVLAIALGVIGIVVAAGNVWAFFIQWLTLLGILVPPIGAIILVDQYVLRAEVGGDGRMAAWFRSSPGRPARSSPSSSANTRRNTRRRSAAFIVAGVVYWRAARA